jgi:uncharacterized surface protein with fasciclin (FAS1) repeats
MFASLLLVAAATWHVAQSSQLPLFSSPPAAAGNTTLSILSAPHQLSNENATHEFATTTVDILSSSPNHTIFVHLLQRTKLIPTLNLIPESTIFAPIDEAWRKWSEEENGEDLRLLLTTMEDTTGEELLLPDNILFHLRQHMLYHILNYTLAAPDSAMQSDQRALTTETTLLYPSRSIMPPSRGPPPHSPWLPQGGTGSLGGRGQKLRVAFNRSALESIGGKANGSEGVRIWNGWSGVDLQDAGDPADEAQKKKKKKTLEGARTASNGVVVGVGSVLSMPKDIGESRISGSRVLSCFADAVIIF